MIPASAFLDAAFTKGEHQPADDNGNERQAARERAGEGLLQHVDRVQPRAHALRGAGCASASADGEQKPRGRSSMRCAVGVHGSCSLWWMV